MYKITVFYEPKSFVLEIPEHSNLEILKTQIYSITSIHPDNQVLIHNFKQIEEIPNFLLSYYFEKIDTINLKVFSEPVSENIKENSLSNFKELPQKINEKTQKIISKIRFDDGSFMMIKIMEKANYSLFPVVHYAIFQKHDNDQLRFYISNYIQENPEIYSVDVLGKSIEEYVL